MIGSRSKVIVICHDALAAIISAMFESISHNRKPWLTPKEQVEHLESKGVRFVHMSKDDAVDYLAENNNYFRLRSYRTCFPKVEDGARKGQYANLDFKMLVDLSIIDMLLRNEMLPMTLDIEHFAKVRLLGEIEKAGEDGYEIVSAFLTSSDRKRADGRISKSAKDEILRGKSSPYVAGILAKYPEFDFPVWAFLELISFGTFIYFYEFCGTSFEDEKMTDTFYLLQSVKSLRNACAHNNCILNDMSSGKPMYQVRHDLRDEIARISSIGKGQRKSKLSNDRFQQIATTLYMHKLFASVGVHDNRAKSLQEFKLRMFKHVDYYEGNFQVISGFEFLQKLIDAWFCVEN